MYGTCLFPPQKLLVTLSLRAKEYILASNKSFLIFIIVIFLLKKIGTFSIHQDNQTHK